MSHQPKSAWLSLLVVGVLTCAVCSGIATLLFGSKIGQYVAITWLVLMVLFGINALISFLVINAFHHKDIPPDNDA